MVTIARFGFGSLSYAGLPKPKRPASSSAPTWTDKSAIRLSAGSVLSGSAVRIAPTALATAPSTRATISARSRARTFGYWLARSPDVAAVARIDAYDVAGLDEQRNLDGRSRFELRGFSRVGGRIAAESRVGFDDLQLDM